MPVRLSGSTSGYTELSAPAVAGNNTLTLPTGNGSNGQFLQGNGSGTLSWSGSLTLGTAVASTSGTAIDFTGIPSWVKRITVMFAGVSLSGTSAVRFQLGTGSTPTYTTSGYVGGGTRTGVSADLTGATLSTGFDLLQNGNAATTVSGDIVFSNITGNTWVGRGSFGLVTGNGTITIVAGNVALSAALTAVRITTVNGTDTFDAGSINIMYEG